VSYLSIYDWPTQKPSGTWSSDGTINANYPLTNIDTDDIATPVIYTANPTSVVIDFGSAKRVDLVTLPNFNGDAAMTVLAQMNATNSWGSPSLSTAVTIPGLTEDGFGCDPWVDLTGVTGYLVGGYRFLRLSVGSSTALLKLKVRLSGQEYTLEHNFEYSVSTYAQVKPTTQERHPLIERQMDATNFIGYGRGTRERWITGYMLPSDTGFAAWRSHDRACLGRLLPFLWVNDPTINEGLIVRRGNQATAVLQREFYFTNVNAVQVDLEEVGRGLKP
jgi:hypothetical protein